MATTTATGTSTATAKIYQFPAGGRAARSNGRHASDLAPAHEVAHTPTSACNSGWYHEAAIADADNVQGR